MVQLSVTELVESQLNAEGTKYVKYVLIKLKYLKGD